MITDTYPNKSNEEIKNIVLTDMYLTGRINGYYFGRTAKSKENPIKAYIKIYLRLNGVGDIDNELLDDCYQTLFMHVFNMKTDKVIDLLNKNEKGNQLQAFILQIAKFQLFSKKPNSKSSGLIHNIIEKSSIGNYQVSSSENMVEDDTQLIIFDGDDFDEFESQYNVKAETIINALSDKDREFFYQQLERQKVGKPSNELKAKREALYQRIKTIKQNIIQNDR